MSRAFFPICPVMLCVVSCASLDHDAPPVQPPPTEKTAISMARLQQEVMDFSDLFSGAIGLVVDQMVLSDISNAMKVEALSWKLHQSASSMEIAAGQDPRSNLLDMAIFVSAGKWALEEYWIPEKFGEAGIPLRAVFEKMNAEIWDLTSRTLTEDQTADLRSLVIEWTRSRPPLYEVAGVRFRNLEGVEPTKFQGHKSAHGLLARIRAWLGQVNTSLLFSERLMFYLERTQRILSQQSDLTIAQVGRNFPLATVEPDFAAITSYLDQWPGMLKAGMEENREWFASLVPEANHTLELAGRLVDGSTELSRSIQELTKNLDGPLARIETITLQAQEAGTSGLELDAALLRIEGSLGSLERSIEGLNQLLAESQGNPSPVATLLDRVEGSMDDRLDQIYKRVLTLLVLVFCGIALLMVLAWLLFRKRWTTQRNESNPTVPEKQCDSGS